MEGKHTLTKKKMLSKTATLIPIKVLVQKYTSQPTII